MLCDPLMRWENEGGAVVDENEGSDPGDRKQTKQLATLAQPARPRVVQPTRV
jgi:hypothetical protein